MTSVVITGRRINISGTLIERSSGPERSDNCCRGRPFSQHFSFSPGSHFVFHFVAHFVAPFCTTAVQKPDKVCDKVGDKVKDVENDRPYRGLRLFSLSHRMGEGRGEGPSRKAPR